MGNRKKRTLKRVKGEAKERRSKYGKTMRRKKSKQSWSE